MKQSVSTEVEVVTAVMIGLVATDVAGLLQGDVIVINCTTIKNNDSWVIANYNSGSVGGNFDSLFSILTVLKLLDVDGLLNRA